MNRRRFVSLLGMVASGRTGLLRAASRILRFAGSEGTAASAANRTDYGSGNFGHWMNDSSGLAAYRYTCDQATAPNAISPTHQQWRSSTDHTHQVGNSRILAAVSNYGYLQVRQDEGAPKFLNDYTPQQGRFGAGFGYLTDGQAVLSTYYPGGGVESFERYFGQGYFRKTVKGHQYEVDHVITAPYGDDPVLISSVTVTNLRAVSATLRWVEYWGAQNYQFSYRATMEAQTIDDPLRCAKLRKDFAGRFSHRFEKLPGLPGFLETQKFAERTGEDNELWRKVSADLNNPAGPWGGHIDTPAPAAAMDDVQPPATFLVSLDGPLTGFSTDAKTFFGSGGVEQPSGLLTGLGENLSSTGSDSAFLMERTIDLKPGQSKTLFFLYGYLPEGFTANNLAAKYGNDPAGILRRSNEAWRHEGIHFSVPSEPWVSREVSWHNYYLRSGITYDSYFREHIISQGNVYQYVYGFQGAPRDALQHCLPLIFSDPGAVRSVIRYTLKSIQPDGSIPYAMVGSGVPMPSPFDPSDLEMWLLWTTAEYVLATRDTKFLDETVIPYPRRESSAADPTVRALLDRAYSHLVDTIGAGKHGLMRLAKGDWNDSIVTGRVPKEQIEEVHQEAESVLNAAMASYVFDHYARLLSYVGQKEQASKCSQKSAAQRAAVQQTWTGTWFRRAWMGPHLGWIGNDRLWLEPQPWALIGGAATPAQGEALLQSIQELVRKPSPIGAMLLNTAEASPQRPAGILENGGVWPSINGTLIWALAKVDGAAAWDEWKKNSLALHAESYPDVWYGIWSGPDHYSSVLSRYPGQTQFGPPPVDGVKSPADWGISWTDYPVMCMHSHAWPLYSIVKLLGVEFQHDGVAMAPAIPDSLFEFSSPLLGLKRAGSLWSGWYCPSVAGRWTITLLLPEGSSALQGSKVNGKPVHAEVSQRKVTLSGSSKPGEPLHWEVSLIATSPEKT